MASLYKRNGIYYVKFYEDGKRVRRSTETGHLVDARKIKEAIERQLAMGKFQVEKKDAEVDDFWEDYRAWAKNHKRPATLAAEAIFWKQFTDFAQPKTLGSVTARDVERFKAKRIADGLKPKSINDALGALRAVYNHAVKLGHFNGQNPFVGIQRLKVPKNPPKYLTKEQIEMVLGAAAKRGRNIHLVFALGIYAGLRKNEIMNARWEWFDFDHRLITLMSHEGFELKDSESRTIPLHERLAEVLSPHRQDRGFVFEPEKETPGKNPYRYEFRSAFHTVLKDAGLQWVTPHMLRHTFASRLVTEGVSVYKVSQWLGHEDVKTTQIYAHLQPHDGDINRI